MCHTAAWKACPPQRAGATLMYRSHPAAAQLTYGTDDLGTSEIPMGRVSPTAHSEPDDALLCAFESASGPT
jgi:hypothetical protein